MLFQKKVDRAMEYSREHAADKPREGDPHDVREEQTLKDEMEKGDGLAMLLSALIVILPVGILVLVAISLFGALPFLFG